MMHTIITLLTLPNVPTLRLLPASPIPLLPIIIALKLNFSTSKHRLSFKSWSFNMCILYGILASSNGSAMFFAIESVM